MEAIVARDKKLVHTEREKVYPSFALCHERAINPHITRTEILCVLHQHTMQILSCLQIITACVKTHVFDLLSLNTACRCHILSMCAVS